MQIQTREQSVEEHRRRVPHVLVSRPVAEQQPQPAHRALPDDRHIHVLLHLGSVPKLDLGQRQLREARTLARKRDEQRRAQLRARAVVPQPLSGGRGRDVQRGEFRPRHDHLEDASVGERGDLVERERDAAEATDGERGADDVDEGRVLQRVARVLVAVVLVWVDEGEGAQDGAARAVVVPDRLDAARDRGGGGAGVELDGVGLEIVGDGGVEEEADVVRGPADVQVLQAVVAVEWGVVVVVLVLGVLGSGRKLLHVDRRGEHAEARAASEPSEEGEVEHAVARVQC